jgi:hypothetical protein
LTLPKVATENDGSYDVLGNHHQRNGAPRPPEPEVLNAIRSKGRANPQPHHTPTPSSPHWKKKRARRGARTESGGVHQDPTQLQFYPPCWRDVLETSKERLRCFAGTQNFFPTRDVGIREAGDCIAEVLAEYQAEGKKVEAGMWIASTFSGTFLISSQGYRRAYKQEMAILVRVYLPCRHLLTPLDRFTRIYRVIEVT